jgi:hypothetical protein
MAERQYKAGDDGFETEVDESGKIFLGANRRKIGAGTASPVGYRPPEKSAYDAEDKDPDEAGISPFEKAARRNARRKKAASSPQMESLKGMAAPAEKK